MKLKKVMARSGRQMRPEGIPIYVSVAANPGATCSETAEAMDMGMTTLIRHSRRLEGLGLLTRTTEKSDKGLCLPARLFTRDPLQNEGGTDPHRIDTPVKIVPPRSRMPYQNGGVNSKGLSPTDPLQNEGGTRGTPLAPSKAKNTSTGKLQPPAEAAAKPTAEVVDWKEIGDERSRMLAALKDILGAIPDLSAERSGG